MISVGGINLNPSMIWKEQAQGLSVKQAVFPLLGGTVKSYTRLVNAGHPVTLLAVEDQGWLTYGIVKALIELEVVGGVIVFVYGAVQRNVIFDSRTGPAVEFQLMVPRQNPSDSDYCIGSIKMLTVN